MLFCGPPFLIATFQLFLQELCLNKCFIFRMITSGKKTQVYRDHRHTQHGCFSKKVVKQSPHVSQIKPMFLNVTYPILALSESNFWKLFQQQRQHNFEGSKPQESPTAWTLREPRTFNVRFQSFQHRSKLLHQFPGARNREGEFFSDSLNQN